MARFCVLWHALGYGKLEQLLLLQIVWQASEHSRLWQVIRQKDHLLQILRIHCGGDWEVPYNTGTCINNHRNPAHLFTGWQQAIAFRNTCPGNNHFVWCLLYSYTFSGEIHLQPNLRPVGHEARHWPRQVAWQIILAWVTSSCCWNPKGAISELRMCLIATISYQCWCTGHKNSAPLWVEPCFEMSPNRFLDGGGA